MSKRKTTEEFTKAGNVVHNHKYIYTKTIYKDNNTPVCIICPEHGEFWQIPSRHLRGSGCPECANKKRGETFKMNNDEFLDAANKKHNNRYKYKTKFIDCKTPIIAECPEHGEFTIIPYRHLQGVGCPECAKGKRSKMCGKRKTTEDLVEEIKKLYGEKIDCTEVVYINAHTPIWITDTELNYRYQIQPTKLLNRGPLKKFKMTQTLFVENATRIHCGKYDYSKAVFKGMDIPVCIICPIHGEFWQKPSDHLNGYGCKKCGYKASANANRKDKETFVEEANIVHGNFYSYDNFVYNGYHVKSFITCPFHGDFEQTPAKHLMGQGCPHCNESSLERSVRLYLDNNDIKYKQWFSDKWLKNGKGKQSFDFVLPDKNVLIECQGIQHFVQGNFGYRMNVGKNIERDERKNKLAKERGYRIFYYTTEENAKYKNVSHIYDDGIYTDLDTMFADIEALK